MPRELYDYVLLFFVSTVLGWCMEVGCKLVQFHRFINRGFLIGPYCPIYGIGTVLITALLSRFRQDPLAVFGLAILLCGTLEYATSYVMEKLFHARWWDYSGKRFNLNGRVCADTLIPFGLLGLGMVYLLQPALFSLFARLSLLALELLCAGLCAMIAVDFVISMLTMIKLRARAEDAQGDSTEAITAAVRATLAKESALLRRTLRAFPEAKLYNSRIAQRMRAQRQQLRREMKEARQRARTAIEQSEQALRRELAAKKEQLKQK